MTTDNDEAQTSVAASDATGAEARPDAESDAAAEIAPDRLPRALFGYDRSTIVELLDTMSGRIRTLAQERATLERRVGELEADVDRTQEHEQLIGATLVSAQEEAKTIAEDARKDALRLLRAAEKQARKIAEDAERSARSKANELVESAQEMRRAIIDQAEEERQSMIAEAGRARAFVEETHEQLSDFLTAAVRWYEHAKPGAEQTPTSDVHA